MITANSRATHRIDTALHGGMTNLQNTDPGPPLSEAELDGLRQWTPRQIVPTRRSLWFRFCRLVRIASLRYRIWETERYMDREAGGVLGTRSMREFDRQVAVWRVELAVAEAS